MAVGNDTIADFMVDKSRPEVETSAEGNLICSGPHRFRLFFNFKVLGPQGSEVLPQWLWCRSGWHFGPKFKRLDCQIQSENWTEVFQSFNDSGEGDSRRKSTFRTAAVLLCRETNCAKKA